MDELRINLLIVGVIIIIVIVLFDRRKKAANHRSFSLDNSQPWQPEQNASDAENQRNSTSKNSYQAGLHSTDSLSAEGQADKENTGQSINDDELVYKTINQEQQHQRHINFSAGKFSLKKYIESKWVGLSNNRLNAVNSATDIHSLIIVLNVMARNEANFDGRYVKSELEALGLKLGENNIFHYFIKSGDLETNQQSKTFGKHGRLFSIAKVIEPGYFELNSIDSFTTPGLALFMELPGPIDGILAFELLQGVAEVLANKLDGEIYDAARTKMTTQLAAHLKDQISEFTIKMMSREAVKLN